MKALAITSKGIEDICALEIRELIRVKALIKESCVIFNAKSYNDLCLLCYKAQSVNNILFLFDYFKFKKLSDIKKGIDKIDFSEWLNSKNSFRVSCKIIENQINSEEIDSEVGGFIINTIKKDKKYSQKVDLNNPDVIFFVYIFKDDCYLGIDFSGFSLHKRSYKIFHHPTALRGTIAYALVRLAQYNEQETLLDCFMGSGTIPIEVALYASGFPVNFFNKEKFAFLKLNLKINYEGFFKRVDNKIRLDKKINIVGYDSAWLYVNNAKKNAKIAGVNKLVSLSRLEVEWLDSKFDRGVINKIITQPPQISKSSNVKEIEKIYNEFFYQTDFVLNDKGLIVLISRKTNELKKFAKKYKFKVKEERKIYSGKDLLTVLVFVK